MPKTNTTKPEKKGKGLIPLHHDESKDYRLDVVFGSTPASQLPTGDFFVSHPLKIKDQGPYNFCPGFAAAAVVEDEVDVELDGIYPYAQACKLIGAVQTGGMSLHDICEEAVKVGFLEEQYAPFTADKGTDADFLADWKNYPEDLLMLAWEHARLSYFRADTGPHDTYGNMLSAMVINAAEHRSLLTGVLWRESWTDAPGGIIPLEYESQGDGHAIKVFGQMAMPMDGAPDYFVVQNSWGEKKGDKGLYYFPHEVINKEFTFGAYTFKNLAPTKAAFYAQHGLHIDASLFKKIEAVFLKIITSYFEHKK